MNNEKKNKDAAVADTTSWLLLTSFYKVVKYIFILVMQLLLNF